MITKNPHLDWGSNCERCGRSYTEADLNYEKLMHHPMFYDWNHKPNELLCKDRKTCERLRRKRK